MRKSHMKLEKLEPDSKSENDAPFLEALQFFHVEDPEFLGERHLYFNLLKLQGTASAIANWTDHDGIPLLWFAARNGYSLICEILLNFGASPTFSKNVNGPRAEAIKARNSPLMASIFSRHLDITEKILNSIRKNNRYIATELAAAALLELASTYKLLYVDETLKNVMSLLVLACDDINKAVLVEDFGDNNFSVLSHGASRRELSHLVEFLLREPDISKKGAAMCEAAKNANFEIVKRFFEEKDVREEEKSMALVFACEADIDNCYDIIKFMLQYGASPIYKDQDGNTSVSIATKYMTYSLLEMLLLEGGEPIDGFEELQRDFYQNGNDILNLLLDHLKLRAHSKESDWINSKKRGKPIITLLALNDADDYIKRVVELGADIELKDDGPDAEYRTPLDWALKKNKINAVKALIEANANINSSNGPIDGGWMPLHTAVESSDEDIIGLLLAHKQLNVNAQMKIDGYKGCSALHLAVRRGDPRIVDLLLSRTNIDENIRREKKYTAIHDAVTNGCYDKNDDHLEIVRSLLMNGACPNIFDNRKNTPLLVAVEGHNIELVRLLVENGADFEFQNDNGDSALSIASENLEEPMEIETVKILLNYQTEVMSTPQISKVLEEKIQNLLKKNNDQIVAALGLIMVESKENRKIITDSYELWELPEFERAEKKVLKHCWSMENENDRNFPENMLTWAVSKSNLAVKILLTYEHPNIPDCWRSDLCIRPTKVGSPIRCAVDEENIQAVSHIMDVLKHAWNYQFASKSKQRHSPHPLDELNSHDLLYVCTAYPAIFTDFLKIACLVPAYSWVPGLSRAPISNQTLWVALSQDRSPTGCWKDYIQRNNKFSNLIRIWHKKDTLFKPSTRKSIDTWESNDKVDYSKFVDCVTHIDPTNDKNCIQRTLSRIRYTFKDITHHNMRQLLYKRNFPGDFDVDPTIGVLDMIPDVSSISYMENDVEAFMVPVKEFASYDMIFCCVRASDKMNSPMLFDSPLIAAVVQLHWRLYGFRLNMLNLILYCGLLMSFLVVVYMQYEDMWDIGGYRTTIFFLLQFYKVMYSLYFILHEFRQLKHEGSIFKYLRDPWNFLDIPSYMMVIAGSVMQMMFPKSDWTDAVNGVTSLLLWFKLLYFMRPYRLFGPMVYMIFLVIFDIKVFLVILFIVMVGFGNAFFIILGGYSNNSSSSFDDVFKALRSTFSYALGNYEFDDLDNANFPLLLSFLWALFMIVVAIILLNLLIAIVSESYTRVSQSKYPAWRLEQARIILNIYAGLSDRERLNLNKMLREYPWLQVLKPKGVNHKRDRNINSTNSNAMPPLTERKLSLERKFTSF